jgi:hypothetical protein
MALFVYKPEGVDEANWQRWEFDPGKLMSPERIAIEKLSGMTWGEWKIAVRGESTIALHALLYVFMKRTEPTLKPDQLVFSEDELDWELTDEEKRQALANYAEDPSRFDDGDLSMFAQFRTDLGLAEDGSEDAGESDPKADPDEASTSVTDSAT